MKNPFLLQSFRFLRKLPPLCLVATVALGGAQAADVTWTNTAFGNWSDGSNWSSAAPPASGDTIFFNLGNGAASFNTGFDYTPGFAIEGIRHTTGSGANTVAIYAGTLSPAGALVGGQASTLSLGAGGIVMNPGSTSTGAGYLQFGGMLGTPTSVLTVEATANQTWHSNGNGFNAGRITLQANLAGSGTITVSGSGGPVQFEAGDSSAFTGAFVLNSGAIRINGQGQLGRLGPNALTVQTGGLGTGAPTLNFNGLNFNSSSFTFTNNVVFQDTGSLTPVFSIDPQSMAGSGNSFAYSGTWSGAINDSLNLGISHTGILGRLQGNNAALTSTKTGGFQNNAAIFLRTGLWSIEHANALGAGNSLSVSIGQSGSDFSNFNLLNQALSTNNGINIASAIFVNQNFRGTADQARGSIVTLGLRGTGTASFTGATTFQSVTKASSEGATATNRLANVKLSAEAGGRAHFSGNINDDAFDASTRNYAPVSVVGGGTVVLSGSNSYRGGTSIIGGTTLLANAPAAASSTGLGNVYVGWAANSFSGVLTSGQSFITGVSSLSGLVVGQTITGAGIAAGTTITYIDPTRNRIEISANATASGSTSLGTDSATGVLGGSGVIRPGVVNGVNQKISVAAGSSIAPGNSIGTLVLDGVSTSAPLLTMDAGSTFTFELGAGNTSDQLSFWNFASGDFTLNSNVINFSGAQEGTFTLFSFYSGAGTGLIDAGIDSGLVVGTGLEGFTYELIYNDNNIMLSVIPEPGACVLAGLGLTMVLGMRRRRA